MLQRERIGERVTVKEDDMRDDNNKSLIAFFPRDLPPERPLACSLPLSQSHRGYFTMVTMGLLCNTA